MYKLKLLAVLMIAAILGGCGHASASGDGPKKAAETAAAATRKAIRPALLRLEDIGPGGAYQGEESLKKLRVIADYLYQEGVPFHLALIPRMVIPAKGYDVKITDDSPYVKDFVATVKYMESRGGIPGAHGYTHQNGNTPSGAGFEFFDQSKNPSVPDTYEYAGDRIESAVMLFEKAGITPAFWETPHYTASIKQYPAFEEQFGLLYENVHRKLAFNHKVFDRVGDGYRGFITVPTPLGYVGADGDAENMVKRLAYIKDKDLASFFYHPVREFNYIHKTRKDGGEVVYTYDQNSPLHILIKAFKDRGYTFVSVYSLVHFIPAQRMEGLPFREGDEVFAGQFEPGDREEILVFNKGSSLWRLYKYTAAGHSPRKAAAFADRGIWLRGRAPENNAVTLVADFNGDKRDDLIVFSPGRETFTLAVNRGQKLVPEGDTTLTPSGSKSLRPLAGDFNGDGLADVALYDRENQSIGLAFSTGEGFKPVAWQYIDLLKRDGQKLLPGDFNGDDNCDIAVLDTENGEWRVLLTGPAGDFTVSEPWLARWGSGGEWLPFAADINGDGKCDLVIYNRTGNWQMAVSDGKGFVPRGEFGPWGGSEKGVPLVADLNGDARADLLIIDGFKGKYNLDTAISVFGK
ncbi:MAG: DUF2334 domain-containing protein [Bacillota bacterium]